MQHTVSQQCFLDTTLYLTLFYATNSFLNRARTAAKRHRDGCQTEAFVLWQRVAKGQPPQPVKAQTREYCQFLLPNYRGCTLVVWRCTLSMHTPDVWVGHQQTLHNPPHRFLGVPRCKFGLNHCPHRKRVRGYSA